MVVAGMMLERSKDVRRVFRGKVWKNMCSKLMRMDGDKVLAGSKLGLFSAICD